MSKISLEGNALGSGTITIAAPNTNSNFTLTLPTESGTVLTNNGNQAGTFTTLNTSGQVVFNDAGADVDFRVEGDTDANLLFVDASTDRVGIGTNPPEFRFQTSIAGRAAGANYSTSDMKASSIALLVGGENDLSKASTLTFRQFNSEGSISVGYTATFTGFMAFGVSNGSQQAPVERARITSGGELLVGTTSTLINESSLGVNSGGNTVAIKASIAGDGSGIQPLLLWNSGTSGENLFCTFFTDASYTTRGTIDFNRGAGLTRYNTTSDATLKNIIGDSDGQKSVEILNSTRIREFAWKDDETQKPQIGVIAQELHETFKGAVSVGGDVEKQRDVTEEVEEEYTDEEGNTQTRTVTRVVGQETYTEYRPWGVDKTAFTFHLVAGWQAHEKIIKQQADMIAALEARIAALETGE